MHRVNGCTEIVTRRKLGLPYEKGERSETVEKLIVSKLSFMPKELAILHTPDTHLLPVLSAIC